MDKREKSHFKTKLVTHSVECEQALARFIKEGENQKADDLLNLIEHCNRENILITYRENEDETFLHMAAKYHDDGIMVQRLVQLCPQLLTQARGDSAEYTGQTAFHIAITKGNTKAVEVMLSMASETGKATDTLKRMLYTEAIGTRFVNTAMLGGVPLSVAALAFNPDIVRILLEYDAEIEFSNSIGDTVFHSLIKYAAIYPEKMSEVIDMLRYLHEALKEKGKMERSVAGDSDSLQYKYQYTYVWFIKNHEHYTTLQLAAKHGVVDVFHYIMNLEDVYCFFSTHDGLFDIKMYDVTEVDSIANTRAAFVKRGSQKKVHSRGTVIPKREGIAKKSLHVSQQHCASCGGEYPDTESILEMMFNNNYQSKDAFRLIEMPPVKNLVRAKWEFYRWIYYIWMVFHMIFIFALTGYAVVRPQIYYNTTGRPRTVREAEHPEITTFVSVFKWLVFVGGLLYMVISILLIVPKVRRPNALQYLEHNVGYVILLFVFSTCIITDTFMTISDNSHDSIPLIIALITGWWFNIFFLRALRIFSFFTELIKRVIFGDMLRFSVVMLFELISFTAAMHILFQVDVSTSDEASTSAVVETEYRTYWITILAMFKLMLGLGDIETLYESRVPWLSVTLFVVFVMLTYILLLNALIAMMSQTCALVLEDRYPQWRVQQLSVILFLEDIFCQCCLNRFMPCHNEETEIRGFDTATKQSKIDKRFFLEIHSLQMEYATEEDKSILRKTMNRGFPLLETMGNMTMPFDLNTTSVLPYGDSLMDSHAFSPRRRNVSLMTLRQRHPTSALVVDGKSNGLPTRRKLDVLEEEPEKDKSPPPQTHDIFAKPVQSERSPTLHKKHSSKRKRHKSENLHELKPSSPHSVTPGSLNDMYASAPAGLPVQGNGREVDIHTVHA